MADSEKSKPPSRAGRSEVTTHSYPLWKQMFQVVPADEVPPPVGPLKVVASLRKTGNPPKRKLHLLDRRVEQ